MKSSTHSRHTVDALVIGAGHAGLAMSHYLSARSIEHVILERGEVANSWRRERWDSLQLLTPNWLSRLPDYRYVGPDPDGYMDMKQVIDFISSYASRLQAPIHTDTAVISVRGCSDGYRVITNRGEWRTRTLVVASGAFNLPLIPAVSQAVPRAVRQLTPTGYRNPQQLEDGGVLVVGASATGLQLAEEIHASGRPVTMAVGEHVRLPRVYRGRDIQWWMSATGILDEGLDDVDDVNRVRRVPSPQLIGSADRRTLDLNTLTAKGVRLAGRLVGIRDSKAQFSGSLRNVCALADLKMGRLLDSIDEWINSHGGSSDIEPVERPEATRVSETPCLGVDLGSGEIRTIIWATGFRPDYSWIDVPVFDRKGQIRHNGGVVDTPGMYVLGLPFLRRRKSTFIHGAEDDTRELCTHLASYLDSITPQTLFKAAV